MENGIDSLLRNITMLLAIMLILIAIKKIGQTSYQLLQW